MTRSMRTGGRAALAATGGLAALLASIALLLALAPRAEAYVYWTSALGSITRTHDDGSNGSTLVTGLGTGVIGVHVDDRYLWWVRTSTGALGRANRDGSDVDGSFVAGSGMGTDVASDDEHVWWVTGGTINRARRDGGDAGAFLAGSGAHGVAVAGGYVYWTRPAANAIGRARVDGSGVDQTFITGANQPAGIDVDGEHVYWANGTSQIARASVDGSGVALNFVTGQSSPTGVAVSATHVHWGNAATNQIGRANLDGSGVNPVFGGPTTGINGVAVDALPVTPTLSGTMLAGSVYVGSDPFRLRIRLDGGSHPTGSLTARLYGPGDATCSRTPVTAQTIPVSGNGDYPAEFTPSLAGDYRWRVVYVGDSANRSLWSGACGLGGVFTAERRQWSVRASVPAATTVAGEPLSATATIGDFVCPSSARASAWRQGWGCLAGPRGDGAPHGRAAPRAAVEADGAGGRDAAGGATPRATGDPDASIVFRLYGPGDATCSLPPVFEDAVGVSPVLGRATRSAAFVPAAAGDHRWTVEYTGDDANEAIAAVCAEAAVVEVGKATPALALTATPQQATAGDPLDATATLSGGFEPAGELTFALHEPGDEQCTAPPVHVARAVVGGMGASAAATGGAGANAAASGGTTGELVGRAAAYAATAPGTYRWVVSYAGDAANDAVATDCGDAGAAVTVTARPVDPGPPPPPQRPVDPPPAPPARPAPALSGFTLSGRCARPAARGAVTVALRLRMARAGTVQVKVERALGTRGLARCPAANPTARFGGRFRTVVTKRAVETVAEPRASTAALARLVRLRLRLEPALYRITVRTRTAGGRLSAPRTRFLRVLSPRG